MNITPLPLDQIEPNTFNPNKMPVGTFKKLKLSIKKFGLFNPIIVRKKGEKYEIVDGEHRWKAYRELGITSISARIVEATDEEVKQIIFATKITGKHNAYDSQNVLKGILNSDSDTLSACNLDKTKLERKTKYINFTKGEAIQKGKRQLVDESYGLPEMKEYITVLAIPLSKEQYEEAIKVLEGIDKDLSKALMVLINTKRRKVGDNDVQNN